MSAFLAVCKQLRDIAYRGYNGKGVCITQTISVHAPGITDRSTTWTLLHASLQGRYKARPAEGVSAAERHRLAHQAQAYAALE